MTNDTGFEEKWCVEIRKSKRRKKEVNRDEKRRKKSRKRKRKETRGNDLNDTAILTPSTRSVFNLCRAWKADSSVGKNATAKSDWTSLDLSLILTRSQFI